MRYLAILLISAALSFGGAVGPYTSMTNEGVNWASEQIILELSTVANELQFVRDEAQRGILEAGDNAAAAPVLQYTNEWTHYEMQLLVEDALSDFMPTNATIEGVTNSTLSPITAYSNWVHFATVAGLSTNGWRNCTTNWPTDWEDFEDSAYEFSQTFETTRVINGDYRGPWVVDDLQRAFDALGWEFRSASWNLNGSYSNDVEDTGGSTVWATAKAGVQWPPSDIENYDDDEHPAHVYAGRATSPMVPTNFTARGLAVENNALISDSIFTNISVIIDFYTRATVSGLGESKVFDDNGDEVIENTWHCFSIVTNDLSSPSIYSGLLGDITVKPAECAEPRPGYSTSRGWTANFSKSVVKYNWSYTRE